MASSKLAGVNYDSETGIVEVFGYKIGFINGDPYMNFLGEEILGDEPALPSEMDCLLPVIREVIAGDVADGNGDKIAMLLVGPRQALVLFCEGILTPQHIACATEDRDHVDLPNVKVDDRTITVRVMKHLKLRLATADKDGNII